MRLGPVLRTHLSNNGVEHELRRLLNNLAESTKYIKVEVERSNRGKTGSTNSYGDEQLALDILADQIIMDRLSAETSFGVLQLASEEQNAIVYVHPGRGRYSVTVDPLDGSSLVDVNLSVGSIFGVHAGKVVGDADGYMASARNDMVAAMYVLYGPETTLVYSAGKGVHEFVLDEGGNWVLSRESISMKQKGTIYSPGGKRNEWSKSHLRYIRALEDNEYKLRYSGALVADFNQILMKGGGVFCYPGTRSATDGKLRLLMELQPLAMIAEQAGGRATDGMVQIMDKVPACVEERSAFYAGSKCEVNMASRMDVNR